MSFRITDINTLKLPKTHFYSVKVEENEFSEFREYYNRCKLNDRKRREFAEIASFLTLIGSTDGALPDYFKNEDSADRILAPHYVENEDDEPLPDNYGLRLYCYRESNEVVVLFGGDRKTVPGAVINCPNCYPHFQKANYFSEILDLAFEEITIWVEEHFIIRPEGIELN